MNNLKQRITKKHNQYTPTKYAIKLNVRLNKNLKKKTILLQTKKHVRTFFLLFAFNNSKLVMGRGTLSKPPYKVCTLPPCLPPIFVPLKQFSMIKKNYNFF